MKFLGKINIKSFLKEKIILQALIVGLISGLFVVLFKIAITKIFTQVQNFKFFLPFITALGGLISGYLVYKFAPEAKGSGIPYVKAALMHFGNLTRVRSIFVKFFGGIASIATGMSLGREGPSVQLGSGAGALVGKIFKIKGTSIDKLISAGAGSAIAATFNAPIAGCIFVLEELNQKFNSTVLFPVLIATFGASTLSRYILGNNTSFVIPKLSSDVSINIVPCVVLGLICGFLGVAFAKLIYLFNDLFSKIQIKPYFKPMIAGFIVGCVGLVLPLILGSGNTSVDILLANKLTFGVIVAVFIFKFILTPICFASGAVGGIFLPMLMLGGFLGYIIAIIFNHFNFEVNPIILSLIGMASFFSATARTPITASIMVFEMTGGYNFILYIMLSSAISDFVAQKLKHKPIYSKLIVNETKNSSQIELLKNKKVKDILKTDIDSVLNKSSLKEALNQMNLSTHSIFPVINKDNALLGSISKAQIEDVLINPNSEKLKVEDITDTNVLKVKNDLDLYTLMFRLHNFDYDKAFVVDDLDRLTGIIARCDIQELL